jgi:hypothetical protein
LALWLSFFLAYPRNVYGLVSDLRILPTRNGELFPLIPKFFGWKSGATPNHCTPRNADAVIEP